MSTTSKIMYKPLALLASVVGGVVASALFGQLWKRIGDDKKAPDPKDLSHTTREVLTAAALQGLVFGIVKAGVDRVSAQQYRKVTHTNPQ